MKANEINNSSLNGQGSFSKGNIDSAIEPVVEHIESLLNEGVSLQEAVYNLAQETYEIEQISVALEHLGYKPDAIANLFQEIEMAVNEQSSGQQPQHQMPDGSMMPGEQHQQQGVAPIEASAAQLLNEMQGPQQPSMQLGGMAPSIVDFGFALEDFIGETKGTKNQHKDGTQGRKRHRWEVDFKGADVNPKDYYVTSQGELRNFKDDKKNKTDSFKIDTTMDKEVVEYFDNINNKKKPFIEDFEYEDISKPPTNNKIPSNFDEWMTATHAANTPKGPTEMGEYGPVKKQSMLDLINYRYGGDLYKAQDGVENNPKKDTVALPMAQIGGTTSDSLALYNNAMEKYNFYKNNTRYSETTSETSNSDVTKLLNAVKNDKDKYNDGGRFWWNEEPNFNIGSPENRFYTDGNITSFGDILSGKPNDIYQNDAPNILLHKNIKPKTWVRYASVIDNSDVPLYDPVEIWPKSMGDVPPEAFEFSDTDSEPYVPNYDTDLSASLKIKGRDRTYAARKKLAESAGITDYEGTAEQNIAILKAEQAREFDESKPLVVEGYGNDVNNSENGEQPQQTVAENIQRNELRNVTTKVENIEPQTTTSPQQQPQRGDQVQYRKVLTGYDSNGKPRYEQQGYRAKGSNLGRDTTIQNEYKYGGQALPKAQTGIPGINSIVTPIPTQPFSTIQPMNLIPGQRFDTDNLNGFINSTNVGNTGPGSGMGSMNLEQLNFNNLVNNTGVDYSANTPAIANSQLQNQQGVYASGQGSGMGGVNKEEMDMANLAKEYNSSQQTNTGNTTSNSNDFGVGEDVGAWEQNPTVKRKRTIGTGLSNAENWLKNSKAARTFGSGANLIRAGAGVVNSYFDSKKLGEAGERQRLSMMADNSPIYTDKEINYAQSAQTGLFGEDTRLAYEVAKYGSEIYRDGGNIASWFEQNNIPRAQEGGELEVDNDMLAALIAAGADIEIL